MPPPRSCVAWRSRRRRDSRRRSLRNRGRIPEDDQADNHYRYPAPALRVPGPESLHPRFSGLQCRLRLPVVAIAGDVQPPCAAARRSHRWRERRGGPGTQHQFAAIATPARRDRDIRLTGRARTRCRCSVVLKAVGCGQGATEATFGEPGDAGSAPRASHTRGRHQRPPSVHPARPLTVAGAAPA